MAEQLLTDMHIEPTADVIAEALGPLYTAYAEFEAGLAAREVHALWRYYNDAKGWLGKGVYAWTNTRGTKKEATVCWLSVWTEFFRVGIMIPARCRADVLALPISDATKKQITETNQLGKMKTIPLGFDLCDESLFDDVYALIAFKKKLG